MPVRQRPDRVRLRQGLAYRARAEDRLVGQDAAQALPRALRKGRTYRLVGAKSIFTDGSRYSVLAARTNGRQVKSFRLFVGAAGE